MWCFGGKVSEGALCYNGDDVVGDGGVILVSGVVIVLVGVDVYPRQKTMIVTSVRTLFCHDRGNVK